ncbi:MULTISPECIES: hypothetical protein [Brevibacterium]|uniref:Uncharacterized protein n=1 Tax=Brevibacterium salitolerans TaxID=1403566 RepID=A0ABN2WGW2_9MICO|nr:hypothetical protein [Brevibacterium sp.]
MPVLLCAGLALPRLAEATEAGWTRTAAVQAEASALTVPAPALTRACEFRPGLLGLGARVLIHWRLPAGYALSDAEVVASTSGLGSVLAPLTGFSLSGSTAQNSDGTLTTTVPTNLLGGLLGLGSELEIAVRVKGPGGWTSQRASVATNAGLLAGIGGSCRNLS